MFEEYGELMDEEDLINYGCYGNHASIGYYGESETPDLIVGDPPNRGVAEIFGMNPYDDTY